MKKFHNVAASPANQQKRVKCAGNSPAKGKLKKTKDRKSVPMGQKPRLKTVLTSYPAVGAIYSHLHDSVKSLKGLSPSEDFKCQYLLTSLLSKFVDGKTPESELDERAIKKMLNTEGTCGLINRKGFPNVGFSYKAERFNTIMLYAQRDIKRILSEFSYDVFASSGFSSGASTSRRKPKGDPYFKYRSDRVPLDVTPKAYPYALALVKMTPFWAIFSRTSIKLVAGNSIFTVPKTSDINRCCAKEPDLNMALQRAVGRYIRRNLLIKADINLNDQRINQRLAKAGSESDSLATIDLSSASDSLSVHLVRELLPPDWYKVLDDLRSPVGLLPSGSSLTWEKFSSMGNGFTFELESLIFIALTRATLKYEESCGTHFGDTRTSVYGDDIICPSDIAASVIDILSDVGFATNTDKTFIKGPFRESCGKHYYEGHDVTPFYIKTGLETIPDCIRVCNRIRQWAYEDELEMCDDTYYPLWKFVSRFIPKRLKGGKNIESILSLYSPGKPRDVIRPLQTSTRIYGVNAYLRSEQNKAESRYNGDYVSKRSLNLLQYIDIQHCTVYFEHSPISEWGAEMLGSESYSDHLSHVSGTYFKYAPDVTPYDPMLHLFSREIV